MTMSQSTLRRWAAISFVLEAISNLVFLLKAGMYVTGVVPSGSSSTFWTGARGSRTLYGRMAKSYQHSQQVRFQNQIKAIRRRGG